VILPVAMLVYCVGATLLRTVPRKDLQELYRAVRYKTQRTSHASIVKHAETELDMTVVDSMHVADEDTLPMLAAYSITLRLQKQRINIPHDREKVEPNMTVVDPLSLEEEETAPRKAVSGATQRHAHQITPILLECQREIVNSGESIIAPEVE
jgi:hypothetical protein